MSFGLWWAAAAWAKKPPPPDPVVAAQESAACDPDVPENYQIHTGYASDLDSAAAIRAAVDDARRKALDAACSGKSPTRCEVLARHVEAWKQPYWNPETHQACAHVGLRRDYLDDDRGDQQRLSAELARLAGDVAQRTGTAALWIAPPTWATTGCHAGPAGSAMTAELRNGLAAVGTVRLAPSPDRAARALLTLDVRGADVVVSARLQEAGRSDWLPLVGFNVPGDLVDLEGAGGDCRFDQELGLVDGQDPGKDGRTVRVVMPGDGAYCEGDRVEPVVVVDRPSIVRVFSVARGGEAYLVWPPPGQSGRVEASASLGELELVRTPDLGDEKLVAVAAAPGHAGSPEGWTAFCKVPGALTGATWSADAAAGASTFVVQPFDAPACARRGVGARAPGQVPVAPACGR